MPPLRPEEITTLRLVAFGGDHAVLDAAVLRSLRDEGLVEIAGGAWEVTRSGQNAIEKMTSPPKRG